MTKATVRLLPGGVQQVLEGATGIGRFAPAFFTVGDLAGYTASDSDITSQGNLVFTGSPSLIQSRVINANATRLTMTIPEGVGPFQIGNLMLYTSSLGEGNSQIPFAEVVLPFQITKNVSQYDSGRYAFPNPGSRIIVSINLYHTVVQPDDPSSGIVVDVTVISPEYSSLPFFDTDANLPAASLNPWQQFVVNELTATGGPGFVTKRDDGTYWVLPSTKNIHHPAFDVLSGGNSGDAYAVDRNEWLWGGKFTMQTVARGTVGGTAFVGYTPYGDSFVGGIGFTSYANSPATQ